MRFSSLFAFDDSRNVVVYVPIYKALGFVDLDTSRDVMKRLHACCAPDHLDAA